MMMSAALLTLFLCLITAVSRVFLKKGLRTSNALTGMVASIVIGAVALDLTALLLVPWPQHATWHGFAFFAGIGVIAPPVVRYLTYVGIDRLGASRSDPVRSLTVFFAIFFAIVFLGEPFDVRIMLGAGLIFLGVVFISRPDGKPATETQRAWKTRDLLFPLGAAVVAGAVANLRKHGATLLDSPIVAAAVAATSAVIVFAVFLVVTGKHRQIKLDANSRKFFLIAGLCTALTDVLDLVVLKMGSVSVVVPLLAASPLFVILLSYFFLKDLEKITPVLVMGALTIFAGVQVILAVAR